MLVMHFGSPIMPFSPSHYMEHIGWKRRKILYIAIGDENFN
jgi:hypothetical protein